MHPELFIVFADEDNVVHLFPMREAHVTALRSRMSVEYRGRAFAVKPGTHFQVSDLANAVNNFNTTATLLASTAKEE